MLIELLSQSNYGSYNVRVANIIGLESAVYLNEIMNINEKALRKNKVDNNFFTLDRKYIKDRTTLDEDKQREIEQKLVKIGIIEKVDESSAICLNITVLTSILMSPDEDLVKNIKKLSKIKSSGKVTKAQQIKDNLKELIITTNGELRDAYSEWIDAVMSRQGWMSAKSVTVAQKNIDTFSDRNLDIALKILEIATINAYRDIDWAINVYKKDYNVNYCVIQNKASDAELKLKPRVGEEVF